MTIRKLRSLFILSLFVVSPALADPVATASADGVLITFYSDKCALKEVVNLPYRAVWTEGGKSVEGCYTARPEAGVVVCYFADKTVGLVPYRALKEVKET